MILRASAKVDDAGVDAAIGEYEDAGAEVRLGCASRMVSFGERTVPDGELRP